MDLLSSGVKRSSTGPVHTVHVPEVARNRSNSTPTPAHPLHYPKGPNYGTHLQVPSLTSDLSGGLIWRRHSSALGKWNSMGIKLRRFEADK